MAVSVAVVPAEVWLTADKELTMRRAANFQAADDANFIPCWMRFRNAILLHLGSESSLRAFRVAPRMEVESIR